ncbi:MAG: AAA family ATPase [Rhodospirillales bacterium]
MNALSSASPGERYLIANATSDETTVLLNREFDRRGWSARALPGDWRGLLMSVPERVENLLLIADLCDVENPAQAFDEIAAGCPDGASVIVIGDRNDARLCRSLLAAGADDYLVAPVREEDLTDAIESVLAMDSHPVTGGRPDKPTDRARIIAVTGARGGVGATTVAVNLGWLLAHEQSRRVAIVDLDLGYGTVALSLDLEAGRGLEEALANPERIDGLFLDRAMVKPSDRLAVLGGGETDAADIYDAAGLRALLEQLSGQVDDIIIDLPRQGRVLRDAAFAVADRSLIVSDLTIAGLRDSVRLIRMAGDKGAGAVDVVINRQGARRKGEMALKTFVKGIGREPVACLAEDMRVAEAGMAGAPIARQSGGRKSLVRFRRLIQALSPAAAPVVRGLFGLGRVKSA